MVSVYVYIIFVFKHFVCFLQILHKQVTARGFSVLLQCARYFSKSIAGISPHNSYPRPASAAALLKQELAATSAAGAFDADSSGSDATAE